MKKIFNYNNFCLVILGKHNLYPAVYYLSQAVIVLFVAFVSLKLWAYDLNVPFFYSGDSVVFLMYVKSITQNGWTFVIPQLSAPYSMSAAAFPLATSFNWAIMKIISLFTSEVGLILNLFWIFSIVLTAWAATYSMQLLRLTRWSSYVGGILFAFLPFAFLRNVSHINLVYFTVPFLSLLAIQIARGDEPDTENHITIRKIGYIGCVIQGFNYIYFSFFSVFLFGFSALIGYLKNKSKTPVTTAKIAISIILVCSFINLTPSFYSWYQHGKPPEMGYKHLAEAEIFGAKLRKMIAPHPDNPIWILGKWGERDLSANFPNENENVTVRLGLYASVGFLFLLAISLSLIRPKENMLQIVAVLSLFTFLIITVGGFSAVINLLTIPDIRAYNRFSVFIAFFSIIAASWWLSETLRKKRSKTKTSIITTLVVCFVIISLYDQLLDRKGLLYTQENDMQSAYRERAFVAKIENLYPSEKNIFQLPVTGFPPLSAHERMWSYDHLKPYLWSHHINWSWPSFSQQHRAWQDNIARLSGYELIKNLVLSGFDIIWVDRFAYKDNGSSLVLDLTENGAKEVLVGESKRYVILDINHIKNQLLAQLGTEKFQLESNAIFNSVLVKWKKGFYPVEKRPDGIEFRWSESESLIEVRNPNNKARLIRFTFEIQTQDTGIVKIENSYEVRDVRSSSMPTEVTIEMSIKAMQKEKLKFSTNVQKVNAPGDTRDMYFAIINPKIIESKMSQIK